MLLYVKDRAIFAFSKLFNHTIFLNNLAQPDEGMRTIKKT